MSAQEIHHFQVPDWYITERETEKTIQKLNSLKELDYYLQSPDEYIRRLAILRLQKISSKEAVYVLKEILDSPAEASGNRYISRWIMNSLLKGKDDVMFMSSRYGDNLSGSERYEELFPVVSAKTSASVNFNFDLSPSHSAFTLDEEDTVLERDVYFESEFDYGQWLRNFITSAIKNIRKSILVLPALLIGLIKKAIARVSEQKKNRKLNHASSDAGKKRSGKSKSRTGAQTSDDSYYSLRNKLYKKKSFFTCVKKGAFQLFYGLFFPIRFIRRHKFLSFIMLLTVYLLLANTDHGRALTTKYFRFDLKTSQTFALQKLEVCTSYLSNEFNRLTGMDDWNKDGGSRGKTSAQASTNVDISSVSKDRLYSVSAKSGLNIRVSPNPGSGRVGDGPLEFGSTVIFLDKQEKDASGITWYYIEAADGRIGWVSSRYLKEKEG